MSSSAPPTYIREYIHCPWEAPATMLAKAGVAFGRNYPKRIIVNLDEARRRSLQAVLEVRRGPGAKYVLPDGNEVRQAAVGGAASRWLRHIYQVVDSPRVLC